MSLKKTLAFLVLLAAIFGYIYLVEFPKEQAKKASESMLGSFIPQELRSISIKSGSDEFRLVNKNTPPSTFSDSEKRKLKDAAISSDDLKSWRIEGMEEVPVDVDALSAYVNVLKGLSFGDALPKEEIGVDLKPFGLETPGLIIGVSSGNIERKALFGKESEYLSKRYIKFQNASDIFLAPTHQLTSLSKTKEDFRKKKLLSLTEPSLERITLKRDGAEIELTQNTTERTWRITKPIDALAGRMAIGSLIRELNDMSANTLVEFGSDVNDEKYGLSAPNAEIVIKEGGKEPYSIKIARKEKGTPENKSGDETVYLRVSNVGVIGESTPNPMYRVVPDLKDLREKNQFPFNQYETTKIIISEKGKPDLVIEKKENEWFVGDKKGDSVFIQEYLQKLSKTESVRFPESTSEIADPLLKITVYTKEGSEKALKIGEQQKDGGNLAEGLEMFIIDSKAYERLIPKVETLLPTKEASN